MSNALPRPPSGLLLTCFGISTSHHLKSNPMAIICAVCHVADNGPHSTKMKVFTLIGLTCLLIFRSILSYATIYMRKQKRLPLQKLQTRPGIQANDPASEGAANVLKTSHTRILKMSTHLCNKLIKVLCSTSTQFEDQGADSSFSNLSPFHHVALMAQRSHLHCSAEHKPVIAAAYCAVSRQARPVHQNMCFLDGGFVVIVYSCYSG